MESPEIYNMKLHEEISLTNWIDILRVPGGWIYQASQLRYDGDNMAVFVPFNNEFQVGE